LSDLGYKYNKPKEDYSLGLGLNYLLSAQM